VVIFILLIIFVLFLFPNHKPRKDVIMPMEYNWLILIYATTISIKIQNHSQLTCIISYHIFSLRGPLQDYKIRMDMERVIFAWEFKKWIQYKSVQF